MSLSAFRPFIWISNIWKEFGWDAIIYMAALTAIDPQLYEAASIDASTDDVVYQLKNLFNANM